ncbi:putative phenylalanine ammonia-lyase [Thozetella sp. PMI_491]|nr:putative phenylalanine ammonia-lyase [Thozetella sp. PMI_491]
MDANRHAEVTLSTWNRLNKLNIAGGGNVFIDGNSLSIADVVASARYCRPVKMDGFATTMERVDSSSAYLHKLLDQGEAFYGVTTGFGGSANTRSADTNGLQTALMQMQHCGVLASHRSGIKMRKNHDSTSMTSMPEAWVRAAMLVRCNTLIRGHSAVRYSIIKMLERLINEDYVPLVPLRGSISASGDLSPLSYISGVLEGNPKLSVWTGQDESRALISANQALEDLHLDPVTFGPKEALGLINGTAVSAGVAALALNEVHQLAVLSQALTAMGVEALCGTAESFHPFLAQVRPHPGQIEAARNIRGFLRGSRLAKECIPSASLKHSDALWQDRYPLRTSTQWIGPLLEDLVLAHDQITTELNSTTDNPVVDMQEGRIIHGGNFQAVAVTSAMEKARSALQMMGKMLFAQCTELMSPNMSNGLPPNLVFDEPSISYSFKVGIDIAMAAYTSELGFLSHPVGPHVQSAEMANQAINSLALISARYTHTAIDLFSMLAASSIYALCQALDLRVLQVRFHEKTKSALSNMTKEIFGPLLTEESLDELFALVWGHVVYQLAATATQDSSTRFQNVAESAQAVFLTNLPASKFLDIDSMSGEVAAIRLWALRAPLLMQKEFEEARRMAVADCNTSAYLGSVSRAIYEHVRVQMAIPLNRGLIDHPSVARHALSNGNENHVNMGGVAGGHGVLIGDCVTQIYTSIRSGELLGAVMGCLSELGEE